MPESEFEQGLVVIFLALFVFGAIVLLRAIVIDLLN
jgi:hypothetical protein